MRLWIDTDVGDDPDDAIALLAARGHPDVELVGVSTVDGDHTARGRAARAVVDAPVHRGDDPGLGAAVAAAAADALLAIGPLTNVAALVNAGVALPPLTIMGGLLSPVRHWGSLRQVEHNFARDPGAAGSVLTSCAPVHITPLDVTVSTRLDPAALDRLVASAPVLAPSVEAWLARQADAGVTPEEQAVFLHDPLALLALLDPTLVSIEDLTVAVGPDGCLVESVDAPHHRVVRAADVPRLVEHVLGLVARAVG